MARNEVRLRRIESADELAPANALAREFGLPIRYVGLGESAEDLRVFDAQAFVDGLLPPALGVDA